ncbi:NUDIX domain-containing protein [Streptomyces otsuchiensis]|uniref:NUDIX domain-containing protein n=1 Tax=Streptomyces otsuchiensis TaxID=2681388 RepID=UPI0010310514|nr:NUDIX hydrolase [Streptomyces otsuchiensis]
MTESIATARLTADVIATAPTPEGPAALLIRRGWDPHAGMWALPGGHQDVGEESATAAARELREETGLRISPSDLTYVGTWAAPGRDPRGRYVTDAYLAHLPAPATATGGDDATDARWWPVAALPPLAFDHATILAAALG